MLAQICGPVKFLFVPAQVYASCPSQHQSITKNLVSTLRMRHQCIINCCINRCWIVPTSKFGVGSGKYTTTRVEYAENVLEAPGIVQITLPEYKKLILWDFDPEEEGTDDYPPFIEDKDLEKRLATWVRIRMRDEQAVTETNSTGSTQQQAQITWVGTNAARVIQVVKV